MRGLKNYLNQVVYELMQAIIPLIPLAYLTHVLGINSFGLSAWAIGSMDLLCLLFLGSSSLFGQNLLRNNPDETEATVFWNVVVIRVLATLVAAIIFGGFVWWQGQTNGLYQAHHDLLQASLLLLVGSALDFSWYFIGTKRPLRPLLQATSTKVLFLMLVLILVKTPNNFNNYVLLIGWTRIVGNLFLLFQLPPTLNKQIHWHIGTYLGQWLKNLTHVLGFELFALSGLVIAAIKSPTEIAGMGYYEAALQLTQVGIVLVITIGVSTLPRFYQIYQQNNYQKLIEHIDNAVESVTAVGVPLMFGTAATAVQFNTWFLGQGFSAVGLFMTALAPLILLLGWNTILGGQFLYLAGQARVINFTLWLGLFINITIAWLLVPRYGLFGSIYALLITELMIFAIQLYYAREVIAFGRIIALMSKYLVTGSLMYLTILVTTYNWPPYPSTTVFQIGLGTILYFIGIILLRSTLVKKFERICKSYLKVIRRRYRTE